MENIQISTLPPVITEIPRDPDGNPAIVYLTSLPARSGRRTQNQVLNTIASWLGGTIETVEWGNIRFQHATAIKSRILDSGYSPATARKMLSALRGTLRSAWKLGQMNAEDLAKALDLGKVTGSSLPQGRFITAEEIEKLFKVCTDDHGNIGARDAALLAVLYGCGLRREEVTTLNVRDYNVTESTLLVHGKRDKERTAYTPNGIGEALNAWLTIRGTEPGALFLAVSSAGTLRPQRITPDAIYKVVEKRIKQAGLEHFSPHSLRRSFCSNLLDLGVDVITTSKLMGHSNVQTTMLYDKRQDTAQRLGAEMLTIPYHQG